MEKALLAAYTPPLRNKVREPAGSPTPFGWAYPVLVGAVDLSGRNPSADWGRALPFPLPLSQSGGLRPSRHLPRRLGEGACPPPCPLPGATPQSRCGVTAPLTQGSRSNPSVRCGVTAPLAQGSRRNPRPDQRAGVFSRVSRPRSMRRGTSVAWPPSCQVMVTRDAPSCRVSNSSSRR